MRKSGHISRLAIAVLLWAAMVVPAAAQNLTGAGATFPYPIYSKWFDLYHQKTGIEINYQSIGSGAGIQQVKAGTVDFGASDAALSNDRLKEMPRKVLHFPTVGGAVALVYNLPGVTAQLKLTPAAVTGIYMGKIVNLNDRAIAATNPGVALPAAPILAVHRSDGSGTTNIFTLYLSAVSGSWKELVGANTSVSWPSGVGGKGNEGVASYVQRIAGAIGYVEYAYALQNKMTAAAVQNRDGEYVQANAEAFKAAAANADWSKAPGFYLILTDQAGRHVSIIQKLRYAGARRRKQG
jgi:phosphate transport system substrate-binding protein